MLHCVCGAFLNALLLNHLPSSPWSMTLESIHLLATVKDGMEATALPKRQVAQLGAKDCRDVRLQLSLLVILVLWQITLDDGVQEKALGTA